MLLDFLRELEEQRRKEETDQVLGQDGVKLRTDLTSKEEPPGYKGADLVQP
jgi:hypothetical protein